MKSKRILEGKEYIAGEFSLADILHCPNTHYAIATGHNFWNDPKRPNVARWWKNISEREAWKKVAAEIEKMGRSRGFVKSPSLRRRRRFRCRTRQVLPGGSVRCP